MNLSLFKRLEILYPQRLPDSEAYAPVTSALVAEFTADSVTVNPQSISNYHFKPTIMSYLGAALIASIVTLFHRPIGFLLTFLIWIMVTREFYHPLLAKLFVGQGQNLYITLPARSKETQKLILTATYATDESFPRPFLVPTPTYLLVLSLLFLLLAACNGLAYFSGISHYAYLTLVPGAAICYWLGFNAKKIPDSTKASLRHCAVLSELQTLLLKARPLSTTVTFALLGAKTMHSGALDLLRQIQNGPKLTYVVNLSELPHTSEPITIVTAEGRPFTKPSDPTLVELLRMVAAEKNLPTATAKISEYLETFPLLLREKKVVSIATSREPDLDCNRTLRELLAGLIRKLEH